MQEELSKVKIGLALVMLSLVFGIGLGAFFGVAEESIQTYISDGIDAHQDMHKKGDAGKIWRYAQRAHFHATGISAYSLGLILLIMYSSLSTTMKKISALLIGLGGFYPLSWFTMFLLSPSIGRSGAHAHIVTETFTYVGVGGLLLGIALLCANLFLNLLQEK